MSKVLKSTSRGQITIPIAWRKEFKTDKFLAKKVDGKMVIEPLLIDETIEYTKEKSLATIIQDENEEGGYKSIFNADRDNDGVGVTVQEVLKTLKKLDG